VDTIIEPLLRHLTRRSDLNARRPAPEAYVRRSDSALSAAHERWGQDSAYLVSPALQSALVTLNDEEGDLVGGRAAFSAAFMGDSFYVGLTRWRKGSIAGVTFERPRPFLDAGLYLTGDRQRLMASLRADPGRI
jgi:hypothetical protein